MEVVLLPQKDLRALFSSNLADLDAVHIFANRDDEREAFDRAFVSHHRLVRTAPPNLLDAAVSRRNVLVYYGVGGIGKTTLSKQLQHRLTDPDAELPADWSPMSPEVGDVFALRLDLSREAGVDVEGMILLLRAALAPLGRPMAAFDLALARYWERAHRESLADYFRRHGAFRRTPLATDVPELVRQAVSEISALAGLAGVGLLAQTGPRLVGYLRDRSRRRHVLSDCQRLPDLLESEATVESLSYFPHLLAWDLAQVQQRQDVSLVVFVDTFEEVGDRTNRDLERILQRMVWLMPNVFFVVTGRSRLEWADSRLGDRLDWVGASNWPGLLPGSDEEPRQHMVGFISNVDSDHYLRHRLVQHGRPAIPDGVRQRIIRNARGLPLYLDLSVMRFLNILNSGAMPQPGDFDDTFPGVVARVFRDLEQGERTVLRAVSLLDSFDIELATATAGVSSDTPALHLIQRAFVQREPGAPWPYSVHSLFREHVRSADTSLADSWSAQDWRQAAGRAMQRLGLAAGDCRVRHDRRTLIAAMNQGFRLAHEFDLGLGWLVQAAYWFVEDSVWEPTLRPAVRDLDLVERPPATKAHALAAGLVAITGRQRVHRTRTLEVLERCLSSGLLSGEAEDLLAYFRAECQRDLGHPAESEEGMRALIGPGRKMAGQALRGLSHVLRRRGRFVELTSLLEQRPQSGVWHRVWGDLWWTQGRLVEAVDGYDRAIAWAQEQQLAGEVATSAACRAWAAALQSRAAGAEAVERARAAMEMVTITWSRLQIECAEAIVAAGDRAEVERRCAELREQAANHGLTSTAAYAAFAWAFHNAVAGSSSDLARSREELRALVRDQEFAYLCEIVDFWIDEPKGGSLPLTDWLDDPEETAARWRGIVLSRRQTWKGPRGSLHKP